jgi:hypothetical protein
MCTMWRPVFKVFRLFSDRGKFRFSHSHSATPDVIARRGLPASGMHSAQSDKMTEPKLPSVVVVFGSL